MAQHVVQIARNPFAFAAFCQSQVPQAYAHGPRVTRRAHGGEDRCSDPPNFLQIVGRLRPQVRSPCANEQLDADQQRDERDRAPHIAFDHPWHDSRCKEQEDHRG
jgi:hypothetical protein